MKSLQRSQFRGIIPLNKRPVFQFQNEFYRFNGRREKIVQIGTYLLRLATVLDLLGAFLFAVAILLLAVV